MLGGSYLTTIFQKYVKTNNLVKYALLFMSFASVVLLAAMYMNVNMNAILIVLFFYVFPIGILFPTTTELAITPLPIQTTVVRHQRFSALYSLRWHLSVPFFQVLSVTGR